MGSPLKLTYPITPKEIGQLVRKEKDGRVRQRLLVIKFIAQGQTIPQAAQRLDISQRPLRKWLHRFNRHGPRGLLDAPRSGQPPKLEGEQLQKFRQRIVQGVIDDDNVCSLGGKDIQRVLAKEFDADYSLSGTYFLLHRLGFSCLCPRQQHPKADIEAQEAFKKSTP